MNTHDDLPGGLHGALQRRADGVGWESGDHPLSLVDVQGRARGIRRRRVAAGGLAAAAVLAVAVPLGLQTVGSAGTAPPVDPANPSPSQSLEPSPDDRATEDVAPPVNPVGQLLTTDRPDVAEQSLTTVTPGRIDPPGGASPVPVEADYTSVVPAGQRVGGGPLRRRRPRRRPRRRRPVPSTPPTRPATGGCPSPATAPSWPGPTRTAGS